MDHYERQLRRALRGYPPHDRQRHGEEIIATALDLRDPAAEEPSRGEWWALLFAGLRARLRERPSLLWWLAYRSFGARLPFRYRMWARDEALGRWFPLRQGLAVIGCSMLLLSPLAVLVLYSPVGSQVLQSGDPLPHALAELGQYQVPIELTNVLEALGFVAVFFSVQLAGAGRRRRETLRKHEFHPDGTPFAWGGGAAGPTQPTPR
ncbi:hypothetical protein GCM10022402_07680 [Salinactinospora qingdaonensis]|uniref:Uncharacterized protein n=2 Tax=Salinactinospora qingdaonensis TaxID=702744 RepID=A0ABP7F1L6_9ACTN